jgi:uncharacterized repeat protein (TIGR03803 family)
MRVMLIALLLSLLSYGATRPTVAVLYSFPGATSTPPDPGGVVIGPGGVLYGTTLWGGTGSACLTGCGTVYSLTPPSEPGGSWAKTVLHNFTGSPDGAYPIALAVGVGGVLYGVTGQGGKFVFGTAFSLSPPSEPGGSWTETVLHNFGSPGDASQPETLVIGGGGVLYGTSMAGGTQGQGAVFSLTPPSGGSGSWTGTVLSSLSVAGPLTIGRGGVLYGTIDGGGLAPPACTVPCGLVFSLTPPAQPGGPWTETVLYNFLGSPNDGQSPVGVVIGSGGVLYGTTSVGGTGNQGIVYSLTPPAQPGGSWTETVLYNFSAQPSTNRFGVGPAALIVAPQSGVLYGATEFNGHSFAGTLYSLTPPPSSSPGSAWVYTRLLDFYPSKDGQFPISLVGRDGVLYGSTLGGGAYGFGVVFSLVPYNHYIEIGEAGMST